MNRSRELRRSYRFAPKGAAVLAVAGLALGVSMISATSASADTAEGSTNAHVTVGAVISLTGLTSSFDLAGVPGATVSNQLPVNYKVETNNFAGYAVTIEPESAALTGAISGNSDVIDSAALTVQTGTDTYSPLTLGTPVTVATKTARSAAGGDSLGSAFRMTVPFVNADVYSGTFNYVATTL